MSTQPHSTSTTMNAMQHPPATSLPGVLHFIPPNLSAFEPTKALVKSLNINTVLWIDGMYGSHLSTTYPQRLAQSLGPTWSVVMASLGSAGLSWGVSSIARDAEDMAKIITYLQEQRPGGKMVIMGHSTGCQDCMEYLVGKNAEKRPPVDGIILQAPVSDREAMGKELPEAFINEANQLALKMCREGKDRDCLPNRLTKPVFGRIGITARRWVDVASPAPNHDGADDYFSQDLPESRLTNTFGKLPARAPLLILYSGADEAVADHIQPRLLLQRWLRITESGGGSVDAINSGIIEGATHNLNNQSDEIVGDLVWRVNGFVTRIEKGEIGIKEGSKI